MSLLTIKGLNKDFGALRVLCDVNFEVKKGSLHSVVGPNGAGKTTLFNTISGFLRPTSGSIIFNGINITNKQPYQIAHLGIRRSFQVLTLFPGLTVLENVRLAIQAINKGNFAFYRKASDMQNIIEQSIKVLGQIGLLNKKDSKAGELSHGEQRLLDIGVAMAGEGILLLLDEPTSGLVYNEIYMMGNLIKSLTPRHTVILIEHRIDMVLSISDIITVLDSGNVIAQGPPIVIQNNEEVSKAYLGLR
jgi:branched-chain amino acid transport system ATP-binding protein